MSHKEIWDIKDLLYKKDIQDLDNHDGVITHLEPDFLEWEVKWTLGSITKNKASGSDGIPAELFQVLKDDAVKVLHSVCQQISKTAVATGLKRVSFHSNPKEGQCQRIFKLLHNWTHFTAMWNNVQNSPSQASTVLEQIVQAGFTKIRNQMANICWIIDKAREFQKNIYFCFIDDVKAFDCVDNNKL